MFLMEKIGHANEKIFIDTVPFLCWLVFFKVCIICFISSRSHWVSLNFPGVKSPTSSLRWELTCGLHSAMPQIAKAVLWLELCPPSAGETYRKELLPPQVCPGGLQVLREGLWFPLAQTDLQHQHPEPPHGGALIWIQSSSICWSQYPLLLVFIHYAWKHLNVTELHVHVKGCSSPIERIIFKKKDVLLN